MSVVVFAKPYTPPPPPPARFTRMSMSWTGVDGSHWNLSDWRTGVIMLRDGVEGLHLPPVASYVTESAAVSGQRYRGGITNARNVEWPIYLWSDSSSGWADIERAWWRSFLPLGQTGVWTVDTGDEPRTLPCRMVSDGGYAHTMDPQMMGWCRYPVSLVADSPFWLGEPVTRSWAAPEEFLFFGGETPGPEAVETAPPFAISNSSGYAAAKVTNPGDVESWPIWTITGPCTTAVVGVGADTIEIPFAIADGSELVIDTNPTKQTAILDGSPIPASDLGQVKWSPIPTIDPVQLNINTTGGGAVSVEIPTYYLRAW